MRVVQSSGSDVFHPLPLSTKPIEPGEETMAVGIRNGIKVATGQFSETKEFGPSHVFELKAPGGFSGGPIVKFALPKRYDLCFNQSMLIFTADVSEFTALANRSTK